MINHITATLIRYTLIALFACGAIAAGTALGDAWGASLTAEINEANATKRSMIMDAAHINMIHQGWGEGDCKEDEWFDGDICIHTDMMPADDIRNQYTDYIYYHN